MRVAGAGSEGSFWKVPESSGVCWCGFRSRSRFRKVLESSGVCWCRFRREVPEGSGRLVPEGFGRFRCVGVGSGGRFRKVRVCVLKFRKVSEVPEGSGRFWRALGGSGVLEVPEGGSGSGEFRQVPVRAVRCRFRRQSSGACWWSFRRQGSVPDSSEQPCDCFEHWLVTTLSTWAKPLRKKSGPCSQAWHKDYCCWGFHQSLFFSSRASKCLALKEYEELGDHYSPALHQLVARMLVVDPSQRLDLASALRCNKNQHPNG